MKKALFFLCCAASLVFYGTAEAATDTKKTIVDTSFTYSTDSDGVTSRSMKITDEKAENPLSYTLYLTRLGQKYRPSIDEKTLVFKWVRPLKNEANLTIWGGYTKNDLRDTPAQSKSRPPGRPRGVSCAHCPTPRTQG